MAFGPSRHRAWVVVQRPLGCSLGSRGPLLGLLGPPGGLLGASWGGKLELSVRVPPLGPLLGPSWGLIGLSQTLLGLLAFYVCVCKLVHTLDDTTCIRTLPPSGHGNESNRTDIILFPRRKEGGREERDASLPLVPSGNGVFIAENMSGTGNVPLRSSRGMKIVSG